MDYYKNKEIAWYKDKEHKCIISSEVIIIIILAISFHPKSVATLSNKVRNMLMIAVELHVTESFGLGNQRLVFMMCDGSEASCLLLLSVLCAASSHWLLRGVCDAACSPAHSPQRNTSWGRGSGSEEQRELYTWTYTYSSLIFNSITGEEFDWSPADTCLFCFYRRGKSEQPPFLPFTMYRCARCHSRLSPLAGSPNLFTSLSTRRLSEEWWRQSAHTDRHCCTKIKHRLKHRLNRRQDFTERERHGWTAAQWNEFIAAPHTVMRHSGCSHAASSFCQRSTCWY